MKKFVLSLGLIALITTFKPIHAQQYINSQGSAASSGQTTSTNKNLVLAAVGAAAVAGIVIAAATNSNYHSH
jgi:hypothetical protein